MASGDCAIFLTYVGRAFPCFCARTWEELSERLRNLVADSFVPGTQQCLKNRTLAVLDRMLETDIIPLMGGLELVRYATLLPPGSDSATYNRYTTL